MSLNVPVLGYVSPLRRVEPSPVEETPERLIVGFDGLTLDGQPFPWATVDDWILTIRPDGIATLTVQIAVSLPPDVER
jgi:hypothetical protein